MFRVILSKCTLPIVSFTDCHMGMLIDASAGYTFKQMCSANSICWVEVHSLGRNSWINKEILKAELVGSLNHCSCYCKSCFVIKHNIITKKAIILTLKLFMAKVTSGMSQSMPCNCCISYTWNAVSFVSWPVWYVTLMRLQQFTSYTLKFFFSEYCW